MSGGPGATASEHQANRPPGQEAGQSPVVLADAAPQVMVGGDVGHAERLAVANAELARATGQPDGPLIFLAQIFCIRYEQGRLGELERTIEAALSANPGVPASLHTLLALLYCETDRPEVARPHFEVVAANDFASVPEDNIWVLTMLYLTLACAQLNDPARAAVLYRTPARTPTNSASQPAASKAQSSTISA